jgi:hypothetical protein
MTSKTSAGRVATLAALTSASCALAQPECGRWTQASTAGPSPRQNQMLAYDGTGVICFGGFNNFNGVGFSGDTWRWDGSAWTDVSSANSPSPRSNTDMVFDSARSRVVLFGGFFNDGSQVYYGDTWAWDGAIWTELSPAASPPANSGHRLAYDEARDEIVLFGGFNGARLSETWLFDGGTWAQVFPSTTPPARNNHAMAYDPVRERVVMFGGYPGGASRLSDTWEWNGSDWEQVITPTTPPGRQYFDMDFNPATGTIILSSGQDASFGRLQDTWSYDGADWTELTAGFPNPRDQHNMAYHPGANQLIMHGGYEGGGVVSPETLVLECSPSCYADCDGNSALDVFDFLCFQDAFVGMDPYADCNGDTIFDVFDFLCFQDEFVGGCP